jgi:rhomboid protease GluP
MLQRMFSRQRTGSVVCTSCGNLVGVNDEVCFHCGRRNPGLWGYAPALRRLGHDMGFVPFVTGFCLILYALTYLLSAGQRSGGGSVLNFLAPSTPVLAMFGASGAIPVFGLHRWWTVLSAGWLHGGLLHIFFSLLWIRQLAPAVGELYGPGRMVIIYTIGCVAGFAASSLAGQFLGGMPLPFLRGAGVTVGASAPIFGLLGAVVYYGRRSGSSLATRQAWSWAIPLFIFGLIIPGIDNYAHAGGFGGGYLAGRLLDPLRPERVDHMLAAVICLGLSILSVVVSVLHWFTLQ